MKKKVHEGDDDDGIQIEGGSRIMWFYVKPGARWAKGRWLRLNPQGLLEPVTARGLNFAILGVACTGYRGGEEPAAVRIVTSEISLRREWAGVLG